jgi:hypothetical protein
VFDWDDRDEKYIDYDYEDDGNEDNKDNYDDGASEDDVDVDSGMMAIITMMT